jgi:hypothetical protein
MVFLHLYSFYNIYDDWYCRYMHRSLKCVCIEVEFDTQELCKFVVFCYFLTQLSKMFRTRVSRLEDVGMSCRHILTCVRQCVKYL